MAIKTSFMAVSQNMDEPSIAATGSTATPTTMVVEFDDTAQSADIVVMLEKVKVAIMRHMGAL